MSSSSVILQGRGFESHNTEGECHNVFKNSWYPQLGAEKKNLCFHNPWEYKRMVTAHSSGFLIAPV